MAIKTSFGECIFIKPSKIYKHKKNIQRSKNCLTLPRVRLH